jgi:hypothetical protein
MRRRWRSALGPGWSGQAATSNRRAEPGKLHDADDLTRTPYLPKTGAKGEVAVPEVVNLRGFEIAAQSDANPRPWNRCSIASSPITLGGN